MTSPPCRHGYSEAHIARDFTDPKDPLENRVDDCGNPYLGSGIPYPCPRPPMISTIWWCEQHGRQANSVFYAKWPGPSVPITCWVIDTYPDTPHPCRFVLMEMSPES